MYNIDNIYVVSWLYRFAANDNKDCLQVQMTELIQFRPTRLISQLVTMSLGYTTALPVTATARPSGRSSRVVTISPAPAASLPTMASRTGKCMPWAMGYSPRRPHKIYVPLSKRPWNEDYHPNFKRDFLWWAHWSVEHEQPHRETTWFSALVHLVLQYSNVLDANGQSCPSMRVQTLQTLAEHA